MSPRWNNKTGWKCDFITKRVCGCRCGSDCAGGSGATCWTGWTSKTDWTGITLVSFVYSRTVSTSYTGGTGWTWLTWRTDLDGPTAETGCTSRTCWSNHCAHLFFIYVSVVILIRFYFLYYDNNRYIILLYMYICIFLLNLSKDTYAVDKCHRERGGVVVFNIGRSTYLQKTIRNRVVAVSQATIFTK